MRSRSTRNAVVSDRRRVAPFGVAGGEVPFIDGQIGLVKFNLFSLPYTPAGPDGECALYDVGGIGGVVIGQADDGDCDGTPDAVDCAPLDPADASMASGVDSDGIDCGDCLDGADPVMLNGWRIDPGSVFPGQREDDFRAAKAIETSLGVLALGSVELPPTALGTILVAVGRLLANEERVGITSGHREVRQLMDDLIGPFVVVNGRAV